jgi:hypothetical protein
MHSTLLTTACSTQRTAVKIFFFEGKTTLHSKAHSLCHDDDDDAAAADTVTIARSE